MCQCVSVSVCQCVNVSVSMLRRPCVLVSRWLGVLVSCCPCFPVRLFLKFLVCELMKKVWKSVLVWQQTSFYLSIPKMLARRAPLAYVRWLFRPSQGHFQRHALNHWITYPEETKGLHLFLTPLQIQCTGLILADSTYPEWGLVCHYMESLLNTSRGHANSKTRTALKAPGGHPFKN